MRSRKPIMPESHGRFVFCLKIKRMLWFGKGTKLNRENQMKTIEIFAEAVKFASEASDIPSDRILSESRDADVVDARMLVIQTLYDIGLYPRRIAEMFGMSGMQVINALQQGNMQIAQQIANCCCENRLATCQQTNTLQGAINNVAVGQERGFSSVAYETQRQTCDIEKSIKEATIRRRTMFDKKRGGTMCNPFRCVVVWSCYLGIKTREQSRASHRLSIVLRLALRFPPSIRAMFERATPLFSLRATCDISLLVLACLSALHRRIRTCAVFSSCSFLNVSFNSILLFELSF